MSLSALILRLVLEEPLPPRKAGMADREDLARILAQLCALTAAINGRGRDMHGGLMPGQGRAADALDAVLELRRDVRAALGRTEPRR